jgi:signal transduction histidine kinase
VDISAPHLTRQRSTYRRPIRVQTDGATSAVLLTSHVISAFGAGTPVSQHTEKLMRSGERMRQLLDDLLDYNRTSLDIGIRVTPEPVDLATACREEIELLRAALPASDDRIRNRGRHARKLGRFTHQAGGQQSGHQCRQVR